MKLSERIVGICIAVLLLLLIVSLTIWSCRDLLSEFKQDFYLPSLSLPLPAVLLLTIFPLISILLAVWLVLRSLLRIKRRESEAEKEDEEL